MTVMVSIGVNYNRFSALGGIKKVVDDCRLSVC